jgi:hypothetical protein
VPDVQPAAVSGASFSKAYVGVQDLVTPDIDYEVLDALGNLICSNTARRYACRSLAPRNIDRYACD